MKIALYGGGGGVGSAVAFNLLVSGAGHEVAVIDARREMATSHVMDLEQVLEQASPGSVRAGDGSDLADADVVVVSASIAEPHSTSRMVFLDGNAKIVRELAASLSSDWTGVLLVVTNPVDPLVTLLQRESGIDRRRVIGYTLNDSLRLRTGIAKVLGVDHGRVEAWVLGEHGDGAVPLFGRVLLDGKPVELRAEQRCCAADFTRDWFTRHKALDSGRSSTWSSGLGIARMVAAISNGGRELFPASVVLDGEYGIEGVSVSVPVTLGRGGVQRIHEWELSACERDGLQCAADAVRAAVDAVS